MSNNTFTMGDAAQPRRRNIFARGLDTVLRRRARRSLAVEFEDEGRSRLHNTAFLEESLPDRGRGGLPFDGSLLQVDDHSSPPAVVSQIRGTEEILLNSSQARGSVDPLGSQVVLEEQFSTPMGEDNTEIARRNLLMETRRLQELEQSLIHRHALVEEQERVCSARRAELGMVNVGDGVTNGSGNSGGELGQIRAEMAELRRLLAECNENVSLPYSTSQAFIGVHQALSLVKQFDGSDPEKLESFLRSCQIANKSVSPAERHYLFEMILCTRLEGRALKETKNRDMNCLEDLAYELQAFFGTGDSLSTLQQEVANLKQGDGETIRTYASRAESFAASFGESLNEELKKTSLCCQDAISEVARVLARNNFQDGLRGQTQTLVKARQCKTLHEAVLAAIECERSGKRDAVSRAPTEELNNNVHEQGQAGKECYLCHQMGHIARDCPQKQVNRQSNVKRTYLPVPERRNMNVITQQIQAVPEAANSAGNDCLIDEFQMPMGAYRIGLIQIKEEEKEAEFCTASIEELSNTLQLSVKKKPKESQHEMQKYGWVSIKKKRRHHFPHEEVSRQVNGMEWPSKCQRNETLLVVSETLDMLRNRIRNFQKWRNKAQREDEEISC